MQQLNSILDRLSGVSVYENLLKDPLIKQFLKLRKESGKKKPDFFQCAAHYSKVCALLYREEFHGNLPDYLLDKILCDKNIFTVSAARGEWRALPETIRAATAFDLDAFFQLASLSSKEIKAALTQLFPQKQELIDSLSDYQTEPERFSEYTRWGDQLEEIASFHQKNGISLFAKYFAFYLSDKQEIIPVKQFVPVNLTSLKKYDYQKQQIVDNTLSFLHCKPANNVLLYGDRGTGKSTMVNAILTDYHTQGLRMIQVAKEDILYLDKVLKLIREVPLRFIIFIDDLTFGENDECFNTLKAILEGSLNAMPENVLIYATTNRRHLIKETFSGREGDELHASDTRDESASLADRFGLTITFSKPNLPDYLDIVCQIAAERGLEVDEEVLKKGANVFAMKKAGRSGRVARQYVDYVEGRLSLGLPL